MKTSPRHLLTLLALTTTVTGLGGLLIPPPSAHAEGWVLFGPDRDRTLEYNLFNPRPTGRGNLRLFVPSQNIAISELQINYPDNYGRLIKTDHIQVFNQATGQPIATQEIVSDPDIGSLRFSFTEPIPAGTRLEIRFNQIINPAISSIYRFQARILGTEANPIFRYIGQWFVTIRI